MLKNTESHSLENKLSSSKTKEKELIFNILDNLKDKEFDLNKESLEIYNILEGTLNTKVWNIKKDKLD